MNNNNKRFSMAYLQDAEIINAQTTDSNIAVPSVDMQPAINRKATAKSSYMDKYDALDPALRRSVDRILVMALRKKDALPDRHYEKGYYSVKVGEQEMLRLEFKGLAPFITILNKDEGTTATFEIASDLDVDTAKGFLDKYE